MHRRNGSADCEGNPAVLGVSSERIKLGSGGHGLSTIGYIIPGLIIARQGVLRTMAWSIRPHTATKRSEVAIVGPHRQFQLCSQNGAGAVGCSPPTGQ